MIIKRLLAMLLALVLVLGGIPTAGFPALLVTAQAADTGTGYVEDSKNMTLKITGQEGWVYFATKCFPERQGMEGWTVTLENDIELLPDVVPVDPCFVPSVDDFKGTFDGKGHYIKIDGGKNPPETVRHFAGKAGTHPNGLGTDVGLFRNLKGSATVKDLIVWLEGSLVASTYLSEQIFNYGALVGQMSDTARLLNCALVGSGTVESLIDITGMRLEPVTVAVGSMVGDMEGTTKVDGLYSEVNVKNNTKGASVTYNAYHSLIAPENVVGGIVGKAATNCIISDSIYMGPTVDLKNTNLSGDQLRNYGGCIVGVGGSVSSCYSKDIQVRSYSNEGAGQALPGYYGYIGANNTKIKPGTCYSNAVLHYGRGGYENKEGFYAAINGVGAGAMGDAWVTTMEGFPSLKWLVTQGPSAKVDVNKPDAAISMTPTYAEYSGDGTYQSTEDSLWIFEANIPLKGRTAPLTDSMTLRSVPIGVSSYSYSIELPAKVPEKTSYYYKFADDKIVEQEVKEVYTSTQGLANKNYQKYPASGGVKVEPDSAGTAFKEKHLLLVAVDADVGNKLPSAVTRFDLPSPPTVSETPLVCQNLTALPEGQPSSTGKLTSYYSEGLVEEGNPLSAPLPWNVLLQEITNVPVPPQSVEYVATGEIRVRTWPVKDRFGNTIVNQRSRFASTESGGGTTSDVAPKPTIYPRENGIITGGVTINVPSGTTVFYTATQNVTVPVFPEVDDAGKPVVGTATKLYKPGEEIKFPDKATSFVVCAVAWELGKKQSDIDYVLYKNSDNLLTPEVPTLLLNGIRYNTDSTYPEGSKLIFEHPELADGEVLFTVNGEEPVAGRYNTKIFLASGGDGINTFDPTKPYVMTSTSEFVSIQTKFHDKKKLLESSIATYLVATKQKLSAPVANIATDTTVRPGASLELSLSDEALAQLNTNIKVPVQRLTYQDGMDDKTKFPGATEVIVNGDTPKAGTEYVSYQVDSNSQAYTLPIIRYLLGDDKTNLASDGILYRYGQRRVSGTTKTAVVEGVTTTTTTVTVTYINPQPISLTGTAGQQFKVNTLALSGLEARSDSNIVTFRYTIRGTTAKPTAFPETDPNKPTAISIGDRIALSTDTPDALIFYTLDGSEPKATYTGGAWIPQGKTLLYNETDAIKMESNDQLLFTVRAMAVSKEFSLENSPQTLFRYQPPASVQAVFASPIQGAVVANQAISLQCATEGAKIFYKTFTSPPDITTEEGKLANLPKPNKDQVFDPKVPILITKPTWIVAIAAKNGVMSSPTVNAYTVAPSLSEPTASLKTGSVVYKGTRIRLMSNGSIAFTLDGSDPKAGVAALQAVPPPAAKDTPAVLYGDSLVIDGDYGKSVIVKAFTYGEGHTPSNVATFTYTICDKDTHLVASPPAGTVITSGSTITLTTSVSDGMVFYSTGSNTPTLINRYDDDGRYDWEIEDKKHEPYDYYQWRAGSGTRKGSSVRVSASPGSTFTVKATTAANGSEGGTTQVFTYTIRDRTAAPSASIPNGAVALEDATVTLSAQEGDIFYTVDGTEPTTSSRLYVEPIPITGSMVLKTIAVAKDKTVSDVAEYLYSYADQAFAPSMSFPGGEIEQGSQITLTSQTPGVSIYYTTNGADPTDKSVLYTSPITVMRPVTIKAIAVKKELRSSAVNSASYTVVEPQLPPTDETDGNDKPQTRLDSLVSRRTYFDETAGPKFSDVVIRDTVTNTILSADGTAVPKSAQLVVKQVERSDSDEQAVRTALNYHIVTLYDVSLEQDGQVIQPEGQVEIGIPIPADYQNGMVAICRVGADNTVEEYEPRRSGSNAYITVEGKLDRYAVVVPELNKGDSTELSVWQILLISVLAAVATGGITLGLMVRFKNRRRKSNETTYTDAPDHFDD